MPFKENSRVSTTYPNPCYAQFGNGWGAEALAKPAREMFVLNLKRLLVDHEMRPLALAKKVGVDPSAVTAWKNGGSVTIDNLQKIADAFGVPVRELIEDPLDPKTMGIDVETALRVLAGAVKSLKLEAKKP